MINNSIISRTFYYHTPNNSRASAWVTRIAAFERVKERWFPVNNDLRFQWVHQKSYCDFKRPRNSTLKKPLKPLIHDNQCFITELLPQKSFSSKHATTEKFFLCSVLLLSQYWNGRSAKLPYFFSSSSTINKMVVADDKQAITPNI